ncbi:hypothetical protein DRQ09_08015, partial [candidate division KSB1 bacterium]
MKIKILFYISGHGFGHSVRCMEVINQLFNRGDGVEVFIRTNAPRWLFEFTVNGMFNYKFVMIDVGVYQRDCFFVDKYGTIKKLRELFSIKEEIIKRELKFISENSIQYIVGDIPPIAFEIAKKAGLPAAGIANFSWDWIYSEYTKEFPEFVEYIDKIREFYSKANVLFRLPFSGDLSCFKNIIDVPLITRKSRVPPFLVRKKFDIPLDKKVVLITLGGISSRKFNFEEVNLDKKYYLITTDST